MKRETLVCYSFARFLCILRCGVGGSVWPKALQVRLRRSGTMCGGLMTIVRGAVMQKDAYVSHTPPKLEEEVRPNITGAAEHV